MAQDPKEPHKDRDPLGLEKRIYIGPLNNESLYTFLYLLIHILDLKCKCNYIKFFIFNILIFVQFSSNLESIMSKKKPITNRVKKVKVKMIILFLLTIKHSIEDH